MEGTARTQTCGTRTPIRTQWQGNNSELANKSDTAENYLQLEQHKRVAVELKIRKLQTNCSRSRLEHGRDSKPDPTDKSRAQGDSTAAEHKNCVQHTRKKEDQEVRSPPGTEFTMNSTRYKTTAQTKAKAKNYDPNIVGFFWIGEEHNEN